MKTIIASAASGQYHEINLNILPESWSPGWPLVMRNHLLERLASTGLLDDIRLSEDRILHMDLEPCTEDQRTPFFETLLIALYELGLHDPNQGVEYCTLEPGTGDPA